MIMINLIVFVYELLIIKIENKLKSNSNKNKRYTLNIYKDKNKIIINIEVNCEKIIEEVISEIKYNEHLLIIERLYEMINKLNIKLDNSDLNKINFLKRQCALLKNI